MSSSRRDFLKSSVLGLAGSGVLAGIKENKAETDETFETAINEPSRTLGLFCKKSRICRDFSTNVVAKGQRCKGTKWMSKSLKNSLYFCDLVFIFSFQLGTKKQSLYN